MHRKRQHSDKKPAILIRKLCKLTRLKLTFLSREIFGNALASRLLLKKLEMFNSVKYTAQSHLTKD